MAIRVLVISDYSDDAAYHAVRPEAEIFTGLTREGFEVHIMTAGDSRYTRRFREHGIQVIDFAPRKKCNRQEIRTIREHLVSGQYDIMHLFYSAAIINGIQAARGLPVKVVLYRGFAGHIHWYDPTAYLKYLHPRVDMIMCNSRATAEQIQRQWFFDKSKTTVISKGHDVRWYQDIEPVDVRSECGIPDDALLVVLVAKYRKMKGVRYLLEGFNMLPPELPIHLLLVGANQDNRDNMRIIREGGYGERIHILGFRSDAPGIAAACDVFALPSIKGEAFTRALLEAMSQGIAPVITDIPGNKGIVIHNKSGLIVAPKNPQQIKDAILYFAQNREACREMGRQARIRVQEHLNNRQTVLQVKEMYEDLLSAAADRD